MTHALLKESIWHERPQPTHKLVQLYPFQPAEHRALIEHTHEAHANSLPHPGRAH